MHRYRSHTCADLRKEDVGKTVRLSGWAYRVYDLGGLQFIQLRDHYGVTQVFCDPDSEVFSKVEEVRSEWVIRIDGEVKARTPDTINPKLPTGEVEVFIRDIEVLGPADELPLPVFSETSYPEETRLKYRFLDLRRDELHNNMVLRSKVVAAMRKAMWDKDFTEYQTPIITASSPEGARDFLVPSRLHPGKFYALPQAPQQFKQLIMVAGFDKYFQIAPCFRDEDPRADRSPTDFYQLDMEMSFVEQEDIFAVMEPVLTSIFTEFGNGRPVNADWPRIPYKEAMLKYGSDKPDLRNPIEMQVVSEHFAGSGFKIFASLLEQEGTEIRAIPAPTGGSRKFCDRMNSFAQKEGLPGMGYIFWRERSETSEVSERREILALNASLLSTLGDQAELSEEQQTSVSDLTEHLKAALEAAKESEAADINKVIEALKERNIPQARFLLDAFFGDHEAAGPLAKNIGPERTEVIRQQLDLGVGDAAFFLGGKPASFEAVAGRARNVIGEELGLTERDQFKFAWIVDFPIFQKDAETGEIDFDHNPFSMPQGGMAALESDPLAARGFQYDLACNGYELVSGAIRNHKPEIMFKAFEIAGYGKDEVEKRFGGMVNAFKYGAPPHGGCAVGIDRCVMLLADEENIREVIMFPMNQRAEDLMMGAPSEPSNEQLRELGLRVIPQD